MTFIGETEDSKNGPKVYSSISGPEPGYTGTSMFVAECAVWIAERSREKKILFGGILTPATAFGLNIFDRLKKNGVKFETSENLMAALSPPQSSKL